MSINWVMLDQKHGFVRLPEEKPIFASPARTGFAITTPKTYTGNNPLSIHSNAGTVYLTNQRIVYLPATSTPEFQSFSCPLTNLHDSHISAPLFGPNVWQAIVQPVPGGGLQPAQAHIEIKLTFKEGGAFDFHTNFERIRERFLQAMEAACGSNTTGTSSSHGGGPLAGVNMDAVHLDELPTYQDSGRDELAPQPPPPVPSRSPIQREAPAPSFEEVVEGRAPAQRQSTPPTDAPPGYEETQQQSIEREFEASVGLQEAHAEVPAEEEDSKDESEEEKSEDADAGEEDADGDGGGEKEADPEEAGEEEEEEEDEPVDPKPKLEADCVKSAQCAPYKHHYAECVERVTAKSEDPDYKGPKEDCVEEFFHLQHCAASCAAPKLFRILK